MFKIFATKKRNVRMKIVASGCDQCVWPVGVVAGCGCWVWSLGRALNDVISARGQCVLLSNLTSLPCFHTFFSYITINHQPYIAFNFFQKCIFVLFELRIYIGFSYTVSYVLGRLWSAT